MTEEMKNIGFRQIEYSNSKCGDPETQKDIPPSSWVASCLAMTENRHQENILTRYIDLASLGTVADCMPLT
jgi:single-stranded DNA-specific DHH superfamily exonuclease